MALLRHSLRLLRPIINARRARLLGDDELGSIASLTTDKTPELNFSFPAAPPTSVTLTGPDGAGGITTYGPFSVVGNSAQVTDVLPIGIYTVASLAENSDGDPDRVVGSIEILCGIVLLLGPDATMLLGPNTELLISN